MTRLEKLEQKIKELERKLCCKVQFFDTYADFPTEGSTGVLYIDEETGDIYIWDGDEYVSVNYEEKICLNTATPDFEPLDYKNPTTTEVETWSIANLTANQRKNGTQLVYFVDDYVPPQDNINIGFDLSDEVIVTSFIVNGDELIITPITIRDISVNFVYTGQLKVLFDAWLLLNPGIQATFDDTDLENTEQIPITDIVGNLTINYNYTYAGGPQGPTELTSLILDTIPGFGGNCEQPDFIWTLNSGGVITLSDKEIYTSKTIYVDADSGSDVTGLRGYPNFPFETFTNALLEYQDNDWIKYNNNDQSISGTSILPSATTHYYDFGNGVTTVNGSGIFIGSGFTPVNVKHTFIKSDGTINTGAKTISSNRNGSFTLKANKIISSGYVLATKHNVVIDVNEWTTTSLGVAGFHSGNNTTNYTSIKNITITNSYIGSYAAGIIQVEAALESSNNAAYYVNIGNVVMNTEMGHLISVSASSQIINDALVDFNVGTVKQVSATYDPTVHTTYQYCLFTTNTGAGTINNSNFTYKFNNIESDLSLFKFRANSTFNGCNTLLDGNSIINKGHLFHVNPPSTTTLNNSKIIVKGNHTVVNNAISGIQISGLTLNSGSIVIFDCNYSGVSNISLSGLVIDATSKIVFRGIWNLGSGYFDLSGVTGAGADNVYFENCTIITSGTNCIDAGSAKNIKVINTYSNKIESANITTLIEPIVVNAIIN